MAHVSSRPVDARRGYPDAPRPLPSRGALEPGGERPELEGPPIGRRCWADGPQVTVTDVTCVANSVPVNVIDALGKLA